MIFFIVTSGLAAFGLASLATLASAYKFLWGKPPTLEKIRERVERNLANEPLEDAIARHARDDFSQEDSLDKPVDRSFILRKFGYAYAFIASSFVTLIVGNQHFNDKLPPSVAVFDSDKDGYLSRGEALSLLTDLDFNGDGKIDQSEKYELLDLMHSLKEGSFGCHNSTSLANLNRELEKTGN